MGLRQAAAIHPDAAREDQRDHRRGAGYPRGGGTDQGARCGVLLRPLPGRPSAVGRGPRRDACRPADRRGGPCRRGTGGGLPGMPRRVSGIRARDRHLHSEDAAVRGAHLEQHARSVSRAETPLLAPVPRLPGRGAGTGDRAVQADRATRGRRPAADTGGAPAARAAAAQEPQHLRDDRLGPHAGRARRR